MRTHLVLLLTIITYALPGQISFSPLQSDITEGFRSGAPVVSIDVNGDCQDDLVRLDRAKVLQIDLQFAEASFFKVFRQTISSYDKWNLVAGDVDNDGWPDIVTSGVVDPVKVFKATPQMFDYQVSQIPDATFFAQGSNIADANGDGYPDIFVCNDDGLNRLYINDGAGGFDRNDTLIDFNTIPVSDNSGNYGSVWTDFDMDNDLDLYIAKCRIAVYDTLDPRRINVLYVNTDTGFVEMADTFGLASGAQSWTSDFADIDNDGDLDILVINHDFPTELFLNTGGGNYADIASDAGLNIAGLTLQSIFRDFDNDGYVDLLISGAWSRLFRNKGDNTFEEVASPFGGEWISSFTIGDFNSDGFPDVYATYNGLYNNPSNTKDDTIWINDGNSNNYIRIKAVGTNSNTSAIGAKLLLHAGGGVQLRELRAGESYGISTSLIKNFGLGSTSSIDSLVVIWANGDTQTHYDPPINSTVTVYKDGCLRPVLTLDQGPFVQCGQDTFTLTAPADYASYAWNNGMTSQSIEVTEPGLYYVTVTDTAGCLQVTTSAAIQPCVWPSKVIYVDSAATGDNSGVEWTNAFTDLQDAFAVADSFYVNIEQIWVAQGTYFPTQDTDRMASFVLVDSIAIYGGFQGSETKISDRDATLYPTRLSGDIGIRSDSSDNSYHVVVCPDSVADVSLDGFVLQDGTANDATPMHSRGAALYSEGKLSLQNCILVSCSGNGPGVYIYNTGLDAVLRLHNCQLPETGTFGVSNEDGALMVVEGVNLIEE